VVRPRDPAPPAHAPGVLDAVDAETVAVVDGMFTG
jgi:hypothetical protein